MATLMEKDVLIEAVAGVLAMIDARRPHLAPYNEDQKRVTSLLNVIYGTKPEDLDFEEIVSEIKSTRVKYQDMPIRESLRMEPLV